MQENDPESVLVADLQSIGRPHAVRLPRFLAPCLEFMVHTTVGTLIFAVIALPAVLIADAVKFLEGVGTPVDVIFGIKFAAGMLFLTDLILMAVFLAKTGYRAAKKL